MRSTFEDRQAKWDSKLVRSPTGPGSCRRHPASKSENVLSRRAVNAASSRFGCRASPTCGLRVQRGLRRRVVGCRRCRSRAPRRCTRASRPGEEADRRRGRSGRGRRSRSRTGRAARGSRRGRPSSPSVACRRSASPSVHCGRDARSSAAQPPLNSRDSSSVPSRSCSRRSTSPSAVTLTSSMNQPGRPSPGRCSSEKRSTGRWPGERARCRRRPRRTRRPGTVLGGTGRAHGRSRRGTSRWCPVRPLPYLAWQPLLVRVVRTRRRVVRSPTAATCTSTAVGRDEHEAVVVVPLDVPAGLERQRHVGAGRHVRQLGQATSRLCPPSGVQPKSLPELRPPRRASAMPRLAHLGRRSIELAAAAASPSYASPLCTSWPAQRVRLCRRGAASRSVGVASWSPSSRDGRRRPGAARAGRPSRAPAWLKTSMFCDLSVGHQVPVAVGLAVAGGVEVGQAERVAVLVADDAGLVDRALGVDVVRADPHLDLEVLALVLGRHLARASGRVAERPAVEVLELVVGDVAGQTRSRRRCR